MQLVDLDTPDAMMDALTKDGILAILNPYGEGLPVRSDDTMADAVDAIGAYVRAGGNWFEVGGYS